MSEEQVLPPRPKRTETFGGDCYKPRETEAYMNAMEASLAQSEAERERLQEELALMRAVFSITESAYECREDQLVQAEAELARERELHQGAVNKLQGFSKYCDCGTCAVMREVIALLEDKSKSIATTS